MSRTWELETARLVLRPFVSEDLRALHQLLTEPDVRRFLLDDVVVSRAWVEETIRRSGELFDAGGYGLWSARARTTPSLVGFAGYWHFSDPPQLQLIYGLTRRHWGRGLALEAARAVVRHGFDHVGFEEIRAATDSPNVRSVGVLERLGMRLERTELVEGRDTHFYVLGRDDFDRASTLDVERHSYQVSEDS